jgi:peptidylprolyl isomerase
MTAANEIMVLETTQGPVRIKMRPDLAPQHVARITELVQSGFYDGIVFHRVIEGFMAQTGCPHGTGTGGSGVKLKAEFNTAPHVRGTASMARAQNPDSGDSQFFICFDDARFLDRQYTVWGQVVSGMENVDKIKRGEPVRDPDKIVKAYMEQAVIAAAEPAPHQDADDAADAAETPAKKPAKKPAAKKATTKKTTSKKKS